MLERQPEWTERNREAVQSFPGLKNHHRTFIRSNDKSEAIPLTALVLAQQH